MKLDELIFAWKADYMTECLKRGVDEIPFTDRQIALMLSKVCSNIQKSFGVIELSLPVTVLSGTDKYNLTASVMEIKNVVSGNVNLTKKSLDWFQKQIASSGSPSYYTILYGSAVPQIWFYRNPSTDTTITVNYKPNFNLYSPSSTTAGDFGNFGIGTAGTLTGFTGDTVFPTVFDELILLGLMMSIFPDFEAKYMRESILLRAKLFNGEKLNKYSMPGVI